MSLMDYSGYGNLLQRISRSIEIGNISHAYVLEGDSCIDKVAFAREIAKAILCREMPGKGCDTCVNCRKIDHDNYEDIYYVEADDRSLKNVVITELQEKLKNRPAAGDRNIAIISDADLMTDRAQNRLLKTLEEPNPGTVIFLLSENTENLLPTILSRCIVYRLGNYVTGRDAPGLEVPKQVFQMILDGAYFFEIRDYLSKKVKDRKDAFVFLDGMERLYREYLIMDGPCPIREEKIVEGVNFVEEARRDLQANVKYTYAIRNLILKIGG